MNSEDSFETRLKRQPQREIPRAWRREILDAARVSERSRPLLAASLFWPHPKAWAALAAAWMAVVGLNFAARDTSSRAVSSQAARPSPQLRQMLRQQEQML